MHLFYTPDITENLYALPEEESKHCVKVLRLEVGDEIFLIDGKGGFYRCEIIQAQQKRCEVRCIEKTSSESNGSWKNARKSELTKLPPYSAPIRNAR